MTSVTSEYENLPRFADGRIDYTHSKSAPVVLCIIEYDGKILIVKRSGVITYSGKWDVITGYIDNPKVSAIEHTLIEMEEEIGIKEDNVSEIKIRSAYKYIDKETKKELFIFPVLIKLKSKPDVTLNHENSEFEWINPNDLSTYDTVPNLTNVIKRVLL